MEDLICSHLCLLFSNKNLTYIHSPQRNINANSQFSVVIFAPLKCLFFDLFNKYLNYFAYKCLVALKIQ